MTPSGYGTRAHVDRVFLMKIRDILINTQTAAYSSDMKSAISECLDSLTCDCRLVVKGRGLSDADLPLEEDDDEAYREPLLVGDDEEPDDTWCPHTHAQDTDERQGDNE